MTGVDLRSTNPDTHDLRVQVRGEVEEEYLRLRTVDRPALLDALANMPAGDPDTVVISDELTLLDRRIGEIRTYLGTVRLPADAGRAAVDYGVRVDLGDGPEWMLLTDLPVLDERVVATDSPLGKALLGAEVGASFTFRTPHGTRTGVLLAVEAACTEPDPTVSDAENPLIPGPRQVVPLERTRALELLRERSPGVARLAFNLFGVPHIEVVNFLMDGEELIFRIDPGSKLIAVGYGGHFALQVDEVDHASRSGWTVTATGPVQRVRGPAEQKYLRDLVPWAAGERRFVIRMKPRRVFGRMLVVED